MGVCKPLGLSSDNFLCKSDMSLSTLCSWFAKAPLQGVSARDPLCLSRLGTFSQV